MADDSWETSKKEMEDFDVEKADKEAVLAYNEKFYDRASELFTALIEKAEIQDAEWLVKRCLCHQHLNKDTEAMQDAKSIVIRHPENYKGYSLLGTLHQIQGRYDEALYCYIDCLEILWLSGMHQDRPDVSEKCLHDIIRSARPITELPENIHKQSILTQLYVLGNCFRREVHHTLAMRSLEVAVIVLERMKIAAVDVEATATENDNLKMKIYFVLAQCQQATGKLQECIENFKTSLSVALRLGDVSYETKAYSSLSALCLDQDRHAEAASYYIRLLAIGDDVLLAVGNDKDKFREHWSMEMEANILLNLCIAFKSMRLYDEAIHFALRYNNLAKKVYGTTPTCTPEGFRSQTGEFRAKSVPILGYKKTVFAQKSVDMSGILQSKFILGDLHELKGDFDSALKYYEEWMKMSQTMSKDSPAPGGASNPYFLDTASAYSCKGSVCLKKKEYKIALECFKQQANIGRITKIPPLQMEAALSKGDALIAMGRIEEAKNAYNFALKLSRQFMDDFEPECMCMWKVASVFATEHRYTHAAYYCEQAVSLATKCGRNSVLMKLKFELALYYQHSTSTKELQKAAEIMYEMIKFQESHLHRQKMNGGKYFFEEETMLNRCYDAMHVILHKLRFLDASAAYAEAGRRRRFVALLKNKPMIPKLPDFAEVETEKENSDMETQTVEDETEDHEIFDCNHFMPHNLPENLVVLTYNLCESGFLAQLIRPGVGVIKSYLSSDYDIKPFATRGTIEALLERVGKITSTSEKVASHLCNVYNTEQRCLPKKNRGHLVPLPKLVQSKSIEAKHGGSGDHLSSKAKVESKELANGGDTSNQQCEIVKKEIPVFERLHQILIQPMKDALEKLKAQDDNNLVVIADKDLDKIPFDALTDPSTGRCLGDTYNITLIPSLHVISKKKIAERSPQPSLFSESKKPSRKTSPRSKSSQSSRPLTSSSPRKSLDNDINKFRENELMKSFGDKNSILSLKLAGLMSSMNKLVTKTATGTNVITSPRYIPPFKQVTKPLKCCVVGSPDLPDALKYRDEIWRPISQLPIAMKECKTIAEYMDIAPVVGREATKNAFLKQLESSTVLHIATYADLDKGLLAFSPDTFPNIESPPSEESYLVTAEEISTLKLTTLELVVLSSGQGWSQSLQETMNVMEVDSFRQSFLTSNLLLAGASCVVQNLWSVPDSITSLFFYHFYSSLQTGSYISQALRRAKDAIKDKNKDPAYWAGFVAYGRDIHVDLSSIRRAQLHASLDLVEAERLNVKSTVDDVVKPDVAMENLQKHFSRLAGHLSLNPTNRSIVGVLIELLEEAMDRLTADSNMDRPFVMLPSEISHLDGALGLLEELGFDFQPADLPTHAPHPGGISSYPNYVPGQGDPAVVFPHWNKDGLLLPAHQALTGLQDICNSDIALQCLARVFPLSQKTMCSIIDLLAVTRHTPEVQLRVQDVGVSSLWNVPDIRKYLLEIGYMPVHSLVVFYKTSRHRTLLIASLQVFASLSLYRDQTILERLNIDSLGKIPPSETVPISRRNVQTLRPIILPRKEIVLGASWMSEQPSSDEIKERKSIADRLGLATEKFKRTIQHAKWWHRNLLIPQAQIKLSEFGAEKKPKPLKRKVKAGATPSCERISVDGDDDVGKCDPQIILAEVSRKRDYAHYLAHKRCEDLEARLKAEVHDIYREYAVNRQ